MDILGALGEIAGNAARNLARNLFPGFFERGLSANKALEELKSMGLGYRRTDFLADFRAGNVDYKQETAIRYVSPENYPSERILEPKYFGVPDKYSLKFEYSGVDPNTGETFEGYAFYHRNSLDTRANLENEMYDYLSSESDKYPFEIESVEIKEGYINPVWE